MEGYFIAQVIWFAGTFAPLSWGFCNGQLILIAEHEALFALIGTTYGGDGMTTFALPDFRGRVAIGAGQGPGLPNFTLGQSGGSIEKTITVQQMPSHTHTVASSKIAVTGSSASGSNPSNAVFGVTPSPAYTSPANASDVWGGVSATANPAGGNQPVAVVMPYLGMNFVICMVGVFPSRN